MLAVGASLPAPPRSGSTSVSPSRAERVLEFDTGQFPLRDLVQSALGVDDLESLHEHDPSEFPQVRHARTMHAHCMRTACALHAHCMCTAGQLYLDVRADNAAPACSTAVAELA